MARHFGCGEYLHRHLFRHLTESVDKDEVVLVPRSALDEIPEDVDAY